MLERVVKVVGVGVTVEVGLHEFDLEETPYMLVDGKFWVLAGRLGRAT
jgi:hypothetical protein